MGGIILAFAAAFSDTLAFFKQIAQAAVSSPVRAILIAIGIILIISAFWETILDAAGIQSNERLLTKLTSWLHFKFGYSLIETTREGNTFTIITEFKGNRFTITKDDPLPALTISSLLIAGEFKELISRASNVERRSLREDIVLELARLSAFRISVKFENDIFEASISHKLILTKDFDEFRLVEGISTVGRGITLIKQVLGKWVTQRLQQASPST
jgi:hypothetical protein